MLCQLIGFCMRLLYLSESAAAGLDEKLSPRLSSPGDALEQACGDMAADGCRQRCTRSHSAKTGRPSRSCVNQQFCCCRDWRHARSESPSKQCP